MEDKYYLKVIEELNKEYIDVINSKEYKLGNKIIKLFQNLKKGKIITIIKKQIKNSRLKRVQKKHRVNNIEAKTYFDLTQLEGKKIAIYTCITGGYDYLTDPVYKNPQIDYYLFTDDKNAKSDVWKVIQIPEKIKKIGNNIIINRYFKMHPQELFENYDYSIYVDGNISVFGDLREYLCHINDKTGLAMYSHEIRDCIYDEKDACKILKKGDPKKINEQLEKYKKEGFPRHFGMVECPVIATDLKNTNSKKVLDLWWQEFIKSESGRDQLALPYILWKNNYEISDLGIIGSTVFKDYRIRTGRIHK